MFRIHPNANKWFKNIKDASISTPLFTELFDVYYLCLLYGISQGERDIKNMTNADVFVTNFTQKHAKSQYSLLTLLMMAYADQRGLDLTNKEELQIILNVFIDSNKQTGFSDVAIDKMNQYAYAGYEGLYEKMPHLTNSAVGIQVIYDDLYKKMEKFVKKLN